MFCFTKVYLIEVINFFIPVVFIVCIFVLLFRKRFRKGVLIAFSKVLVLLVIMLIGYLVYQGFCSYKEMKYLKDPFSGCSKVKIVDHFHNFDTERRDTVEIEVSDPETLSKMTEFFKAMELKRDGVMGYATTIDYAMITTYGNTQATRKFSLFSGFIYLNKHQYYIQKNKEDRVLDALRKQFFPNRRLIPPELEEYMNSEEDTK